MYTMGNHSTEPDFWANFTETTPSYPKNLPTNLPLITFIFSSILTPIVCFMGILGNIFNLLVLTKKNMKSSIVCFLIALAVSDMLLLVVQLPIIPQADPSFSNKNSYKLFFRYYLLPRYMFSNMFITCTSWITVAVTIERFIAIRFALRAKLLCTLQRAKIAVALIFIISFIFHFSKFFEMEPNLDLQSKIPFFLTSLAKKKGYYIYLHVANILLAVFIPECTLVIINSLLIFFLRQHNKNMKTYVKNKSSHMEIIQITSSIIAMVTVFIGCHSIGLYLAMYISVHGKQAIYKSNTAMILVNINNFLVLLNSSVNFILYTAIISKFRSNFKELFYNCWKGKQMIVNFSSKKQVTLSNSTKSSSFSTKVTSKM